MAEESNKDKTESNRDFVYNGYRKALVATFLTLQSLAIIALFGWCISMSNKIEDKADQRVKEARDDRDYTVQMVLKLLRPDIQEIKENTQDAKDNTDTLKKNVINKNKRN